jgi:hypothetical protein
MNGNNRADKELKTEHRHAWRAFGSGSVMVMVMVPKAQALVIPWQ